MEVRVEGLSKRFAAQWVFRRLAFEIPPSTHFAVTGPNGSGKSTLLKILAGALPASEGKIVYTSDQKEIRPEDIFRHLSFAAPYADLIEELTVPEAWRFHRKFRAMSPEAGTLDGFLAAMDYPFDPVVYIQSMSSGMKQRLRLAFALLTESALLILDEPTSNLDESGIAWFHKLLERRGEDRTVVIASNVQADLASCDGRLDLGNSVNI